MGKGLSRNNLGEASPVHTDFVPAGQLDAAVACTSSSIPLGCVGNFKVTAAQDQQVVAVPGSKPTAAPAVLRHRCRTHDGSGISQLVSLLYGALEYARLLAGFMAHFSLICGFRISPNSFSARA